MKNKILALFAVSAFAFFMQACGDDSSTSAAPEDETVGSSSVAYVFGSDYKAGELRVLKNGKISDETIAFNQDSKIFDVGGNLFVLEKLNADNIALVDPSTNKVKWQVAVAAGDNPSDVVKANDDEVWVALEGAAKFVKVSVEKGKITKTVETSAFAQAEGQSPHLVDLEVSGDTLFALFQRHVSEGWNVSYPAPGLLAMYKLEDGRLLDTVKLAKNNPTAMGFANGKLYVGSMGEYNADWGTDADDTRGIELVDLSKKKSSLVVGGKKLGGGVYAFVVDPKGIAYAAVYKNFQDVPLMEVDLTDDSVQKISGVDDVEGSLFFDGVSGILYIGDRGEKGGLYTYESGKVNKVDSPTSMLPVYGIAVVRK